jgi:hypothetical protein
MQEAPPTFRQEDQAVLEELEDEIVVERLFDRLTAGGAAGGSRPPRRASALIQGVRQLPGGAEAVAAVLGGADALTALGPFVCCDELAKKPIAFVHHLAVFFDRVAEALERMAAERASADRRTARAVSLRDAYLDARARSIAAFIVLSAEKTYITAYARKVVGGALPERDIEPTALAIVVDCVDALAKKAREGARVLSRDGELALAALGRIQLACRISGVDQKVQATFVRRADSARASAIDDALSPLLDALREARVREAPVRDLVGIFAKVHAAWTWSSGDDTIERFAVDEVLDFCWDIRRKHDLSGIGLLLAPCVPLYESLAQRIETDPKHHIGYASKCAQVYCFRSDAETQTERELAFAERAIKLCSTHRNGRATVAHILCNRAIARLATPLASKAAIEAARQDVARAEELWPASGRIAPAKAKLAAHGVRDVKNP